MGACVSSNVCGSVPEEIEIKEHVDTDSTTRIKKVADITELYKTAEIDENNDILTLYNCDYAVFVSGTFTDKIFCKKKTLYNFFSTNNIAYLNHNDKNNIVTMIKIYNHQISDNKYKIIEKINSETMKHTIQLFVHKPIFFYNNTIDADVLYKKICFAKKEIFIPFDLYVIKKMEYKIKNFCQITEKLGVEKIKITYNSNFINEETLKMNIKSFDVENGIKKKSNEEKTDDLSITLEYPKKNQNYAINLNKYDLRKQIMEEKTFLISNEEYLADIDLQYLLDSRCDNFIINYNTNFKISRINEFETSIFTKMNDYGLEIKNSGNITQYIEIAISIKFINVYDNVSIIDGTNINPEKYGFINLCNFIKEELQNIKNNTKAEIMRPYLKIKHFLNVHIKAIQKKTIDISIKCIWNKNKLTDLFNDIIVFNFYNDELPILFYYAFKDNLNYVSFVSFRNIILKGLDNYDSILNNKELILVKYFFTSYQVHDIYYQQYLLVEKLKHVTNKCFYEFMGKDNINYSSCNNITDIKNSDKYNKYKHDLDIIKEILELAILQSYSYKYGIAYCCEETPELRHELDIKYEDTVFNDNISVQMHEQPYYESEDEKDPNIVIIEMNPLFDKNNPLFENDNNEYNSDSTTASDIWVQNVINTIKSIIKTKYLLRIKELTLVKEKIKTQDEIFILIEIIIKKVIVYLDNKITDKDTLDSCSYEINGIYSLTRIIDMVKDLTYMCFNEFNYYEPFNEFKPNTNKYNKKLIEDITGRKIQEIISDLFYEKYTIEKLFSNYRFNKVYFTFGDFLLFIKHIDTIFGDIADNNKDIPIIHRNYIEYIKKPNIKIKDKIPYDNISHDSISDDYSEDSDKSGINFIDSPSSYV